MLFKTGTEVIGRKFAAVQARRGHKLRLSQPTDLLAILIATGCGSGFASIVPATFGSLAAVALVYGLAAARPESLQLILIVLSLALIPIGSWAATNAERIFDKKDAGQIVIDEVCGQLITFVPVAALLTAPGLRSWAVMLAGFLLFRLFDIFKPYPLQWLERLRNGWGVMADDVGAGIYAAAVMSLALLPS